MPSAKTYQAIGFAVYHGARLRAKSKLGHVPEPPPKRCRRPGRRALLGGAGVAVLALLVAGAARRASRMPTV